MICASINAHDTMEALAQMELAFGLAEMVELRLDLMREWDLKALLNQRKGPVVVTARPTREGGGFTGSEEDRLELLAEAVDLGADFVDVELSTEARLLETLRGRLRSSGSATRLILSWHDFENTPPARALKALAQSCMRAGVDIAKIVTTALRPQHNLATLELNAWGKAHGIPVISFCMGQLGRASRVLAPMMGAPFTYACLSREKQVAPGQLEVSELRCALEILGGGHGKRG